MRLLWLADVLRGAGLTVVEVPGWRTRGADTFGPVRGLIAHETRGSATSTDAGEINVLINGRPGLAGPIAQLYLSRSAAWHVVASGTCHHVKVGWAGPFDGLGNDALLGIEAQHALAEDWATKPDQYASYVHGVAAIRRHTGWPAPVGHLEHQPGDKTDPEFSMTKFRSDVAMVMAGGSLLDMEQTERLIHDTGAANRTVGHVFADLENVRNWLVSPPGTSSLGVPPPGSVGAIILASAQNPAVDIAALAAALALLLEPKMEAAAEAAVRKVLGGLDGVSPPIG